MYVCGISCQDGFGFAKFGNLTKIYNFYVCNGDGRWYGSDFIPSRGSLMTKLNKGRPWSDCSSKL